MHTDGPKAYSFRCVAAVVCLFPLLVPRSSPSPPQLPSLLFLSCFFSRCLTATLPQLRLKVLSTSAFTCPSLHHTLLFFSIFSVSICRAFFPRSLPSIFSCLVTGNIFFHCSPRAVSLAHRTCDLFKNRFFFFFFGFSIFCLLFLFCFAAALHMHRPFT